MKKRNVILLVLAVLLALSGCAKSERSDAMGAMKSESNDMVMVEYEMAPEAPMVDQGYYGEETVAQDSSQASSSGGEIEDYSEKIIYNANMDLVADDVEAVSDMIVDMVADMDGYISSLNKSQYSENEMYVNMQVRIPSSGMGAFTDYVDSIAKIENESMSSENVTEQYYDIKTRLEHQQVQAKQLVEIMEDATTTEEILMVRQELSMVQENIEVYQGRIRMWDSLVNYSSVYISIRKTPTLDDNDDTPRLITLGETGRSVVRAFRNSAIFVLNFISFLFRAISGLLIPALIVVPIIIIVVRSIRKKRKNNKSDQ